MLLRTYMYTALKQNMSRTSFYVNSAKYNQLTANVFKFPEKNI